MGAACGVSWDMTILRNRLLPLLAALVCALGLAFGQAGGDQTFDVRNGDQKGKLIVGATELRFDSITDAKHSHAWKYAEIRGLEKKYRAFRVQPFHGERYDFQFSGNDSRRRMEHVPMVSQHPAPVPRPRRLPPPPPPRPMTGGHGHGHGIDDMPGGGGSGGHPARSSSPSNRDHGGGHHNHSGGQHGAGIVVNLDGDEDFERFS